MKAENIERAKMLLDAREEFDALEKAFAKAKRTDDGEPACEFSASNYSEAGSVTAAYAYLPPDYGARLLPTIRQMVDDELRSIGIELPPANTP